MCRAVSLQGHFSPSSTTSLKIHGPQEVTRNLIGLKAATCLESARCLSRQGRESKTFTASGDCRAEKAGWASRDELATQGRDCRHP